MEDNKKNGIEALNKVIAEQKAPVVVESLRCRYPQGGAQAGPDMGGQNGGAQTGPNGQQYYDADYKVCLLYTSYSLSDMFIGKIGGSMGEISAMMLLIGGLYLIFRKVISWQIPVAYICLLYTSRCV